ncbi:MAG: zinc ABC transporter substrate-binding protein [Chlamydiota bacterium]
MLVSIAPHKTFVESIAGDTVDTQVIVPAGASSHTFEPTSKQMIQMSQADVWFRLGDGFEKRLMQVLQSYNPKIKIIDFREHANMICSDHVHHHHGHHKCSEDMRDVHIWLSPREAKKQAMDIANTLKKQYPQNQELYTENLQKFLKQLNELDNEIGKQLAAYKGTSFLVSHPAYAYFARDYELNQMSVEFEGRDPTPQQLTKLLKRAKELNICKVFIQPQHDNRGAKLVASHIDADIVSLDPYSEDYFHNLRTLANQFSCGQRRDTKESSTK